MAVDVKKAYFYAPAIRPIFIHIPAEDRTPEDAGKVARLNLRFYGTRGAAENLANTLTQFLNQCGFTTGRASLRNFCHAERDMVLTVHGNDFTVSGSTANLRWMKKGFKRRFEVTAHTLGTEVGQEREVRILNRVIRWTPELRIRTRPAARGDRNP